MTAEKFHYPLPDGSELVIPKYKHVPSGVARKARREDAGNQIWTFLEAVCEPEQIEQLDGLDIGDFAKFAHEWQKDSAVKPGESLASSIS
jgi:hypothetical protein